MIVEYSFGGIITIWKISVCVGWHCRSRQDFGDLKNILYKIAFQDNEEVNAQYVKAQNVSIDQQAQKRDEYLSYQEDMNSKLNRNEQVCIFLIF